MDGDRERLYIKSVYKEFVHESLSGYWFRDGNWVTVCLL